MQQHLAYYARHPALTRTCELLGSTSKLTADEAVQIVEAAATDAGITPLDLEMCQPGSSVPVPFAATTSAAPEDDYKAAVSRHLQLIEGGRR